MLEQTHSWVEQHSLNGQRWEPVLPGANRLGEPVVLGCGDVTARYPHAAPDWRNVTRADHVSRAAGGSRIFITADIGMREQQPKLLVLSHEQALGTQSLELLGQPYRFDHSIKLAAFSPDGTLLAAVDPDDGISLYQLPQRRGQTLQKVCTCRRAAHSVECISFSADGARLVTAGAEQGGRRAHSAPVAVVHQLRFSHGGVSMQKGAVCRGDAAAGGDGRGFVCGVLSPDGRELVCLESGGEMVVHFDAARGKLRGEIPCRMGAVFAGDCPLAFSPDGRWLAAGGSAIQLFEVAGSEIPQDPAARYSPGHHPLEAANLAFSAGGRFLAFDETGSTDRLGGVLECVSHSEDAALVPAAALHRDLSKAFHHRISFGAAGAELLCMSADAALNLLLIENRLGW